jgi:hypothetical protein
MNHENPRSSSHGASSVLRRASSRGERSGGGATGAGVLLGGVIVVALALGCAPKRAVEHPRPSEQARLLEGMAAPDEATCLNKHVQSIWKGEDMAGPACNAHAAKYESGVDGERRIRTVCERTYLRSILTGTAQTPFTRDACVTQVEDYSQAAIRRSCKDAYRAQAKDLNRVQSEACGDVLEAQRSAVRTGGVSDSPGALWRQARASEHRPAAPPPAVATPAPVATSALVDGFEVIQIAPGTSIWRRSRVSEPSASKPPPIAAPLTMPPASAVSLAPDASAAVPAAPAAVPSAPAAAPATAAAALSLPAAVAPAGPGKPSCEDLFVESIWKGQDMLSGSGCAEPLGPDGAAPQYNVARIQNACVAAEIRSLQKGESSRPFTAQVCPGALRTSWSLDGREGGRPEAGSAWSLVGLREDAATISIEAQRGSVQSDCSSLVPRSEPAAPPAKIEVSVSISLGASGEVQNVSAQAGGNRPLEICVESSVRGWRFPALTGDMVIGLPLVVSGR